MRVYNSLFSGLAKNGTLPIQVLRDLHIEMDERKLKYDVYTLTNLVSAYNVMGDFATAENLFYQYKDQKDIKLNSVAYLVIINGYCKNNKVEKAKLLLDEMKSKNIPVTLQIYNSLINGCSRLKNITAANFFFKDLKSSGLIPDIYTWNSLIDCYSKTDQPDLARTLLSNMEKQGVKPDLFSYSPIITSYRKQNKIDEIIALFYEMKYANIKIDSVVWKNIIEVYARNKNLDMAFKLLAQMKKENQKVPKILRHILYSQCKKEDRMDIFIQEFGRSNITDNYQKPGKIKKSIYKELYTPKFNPKEWEIIDDPILTPREKEKSREREKNTIRRSCKIFTI